VRGDIARAYDFYRRALAYDKVSTVIVIVIVIVIALQYRSNAINRPFHTLHQFSHPYTISPLPPHKNDAIALIMLGCLCGTTAVTHARSSSGGSTVGTAVGDPAAHMGESKLPVTNGELDALLRRVCMSVPVSFETTGL
jgi:hypothetical protein